MKTTVDNRPLRHHFKPQPMTYEYACTACGHAWEAEQSISAAPLSECPSCHHATAKRQISGGAGFILKGGGWYADLYSSSGSAKASSEVSTSTTSDTKPKADASSTTTTTSSDTSSVAGATKGASSTGAASS
jgi:putative FmdB family regulatory protein